MNPNINVLVVTDGASDQREVEALIDSAPVLEMVELIDNEHRWASRDTLDYDAVIVMSDGRESSLLLRLIADASRDASSKPVVAAVGHADGYLVEHALE